MGLLKEIQKAVKKITKRPIAKYLDKVVPREIKPFLPFAAAAAPLFFTGGKCCFWYRKSIKSW